MSSVTEDGAVEIRFPSSYDIGDRGDGNEDECPIEYGLTGASEGVGRCKGLTSTGAKSFPLNTRRGEGVDESDVWLPITLLLSLMFHLTSGVSSNIISSWSELAE